MELDNAQALALLQRVAKRDESAFAQVYESVSLRVYGFALHCLRDPAAAREVVSETLYQVWRTPNAFRGDSRFATWVLGIARHKLLDRLRAQGPVHEDIDEFGEELASPLVDGFETIARQERREGVMACMEKLGGPHRECLFLAYYEGLSLAEITAVQRVPENTVKSRLFHARARIKKCLQSLLIREGVHP